MEPWMIMYIVAAALIFPSVILSAFSQMGTISAYNSFSKVLSGIRIPASEMSQKILVDEGLSDIKVAQINSKSTNRYEPKYKVIKLSTDNFDSYSIAAICVGAHEVGHAIQHSRFKFLFKLKFYLNIILNFACNLVLPLILLGSIIAFTFNYLVAGSYIIWAGIIIYATILLFYLVNLPFEFYASKRALSLLKKTDCFEENEITSIKKMLSSTTYKYCAALSKNLFFFLNFLNFSYVSSNGRKQ